MSIAGPSLIRRYFAALAFSSFIFASAAPLSAALITPTISISIEDGSPNPTKWTWTPSESEFRQTGPDTYTLINPHEYDILSGRAHVSIQGLTFDPDPFVLNNILVTNTTTTPQIFSAFVGLPATFGAPNLISGNVRPSVIDGGLDGATLASVSPTAIYQAQIDGTTVATLLNHPFSLVAPVGMSNGADASFAPTLNGIPVNTNIGIQLRFSLTGGNDTAAILSRFDVNEVPEPGSFALIGLGLALVTRRSRSRRVD